MGSHPVAVGGGGEGCVEMGEEAGGLGGAEAAHQAVYQQAAKGQGEVQAGSLIRSYTVLLLSDNNMYRHGKLNCYLTCQ